MTQTFEDFRKEVLKKRSNGKVRNSIGVYQAYKYIRKNKWYDIGRPLKEHEFYSIIRGVNDLLAEEIAKGRTVVLPCRMGSLELRKQKRGAVFKDGKLKVSYPIDWYKTLNLWYTDEEAKEQRVLVRDETGEVFHVKYNKFRANYENKAFYDFTLNRDIKRALKENIRKGIIDALYTEYNQ